MCTRARSLFRSLDGLDCPCKSNNDNDKNYINRCAAPWKRNWRVHERTTGGTVQLKNQNDVSVRIGQHAECGMLFLFQPSATYTYTRATATTKTIPVFRLLLIIIIICVRMPYVCETCAKRPQLLLRGKWKKKKNLTSRIRSTRFADGTKRSTRVLLGSCEQTTVGPYTFSPFMIDPQVWGYALYHGTANRQSWFALRKTFFFSELPSKTVAHKVIKEY
jgi:hypothetical protein